MTISYAITVCDEFEEIQRLLPFLLKHKRVIDEIVILYDNSKNCTSVEEYLRSHSINNEFTWHWATFDGDFSAWKNKLNSLCTKDYIFQIDADEVPNQHLVQHLHLYLEQYPEVDMFLVPRINTVLGLTQQHIDKWSWHVSERFGMQCVNFPDFQTRVYKNKPQIKWQGKVHERITGHVLSTFLSHDAPDWCLYHHKTIERQQRQNNFYESM